MKLATASLPLIMVVSLGMAACSDPPGVGNSPVLQAAGSKAPGSTNAPAPTGGCKDSTDPSGVACKICWDNAGSTYYDSCDSAGVGAGTGGAGGTSATEVKCLPTTDPSTGAACKTCYASDGSYTSWCAPPPSQGCVDASGKNTCGTGGVTGGSGGVSGGSGGVSGSGGATVKCVETTDASGAVCKICYAADGSTTTDTCSIGGAGGSGTGGSDGTIGKCIETTDASGAACKTCYAADGSINFNSCAATGTGASCIGAPNMETGQICKVCSDAASGKVLFVDCGAVSCGSTAGSTPPTK